ncbi:MULTISPECIES: 2-hydroxyacyl-CoA dehydratase [Caproicibacterium]|jgi:predicted nucleotide-binding protein (sugar kinase/HSP70/actin superfamily)|uniref:2-hydroxyglutaryl-CoA dehydratase n=1 Tax=Caproicibacterium lactatifermentans TaxID=2666138 RepID=A0A859DQB5_9FIRM|nr:2-hydroxyglutaryl-CoA dehydratase [Ruminococcaceae bacterium CPB6]QKN23896.1 2-hydroxyglutaryl-CoA dehydratase [Caproicibacterium lactatifermentans]QKO31034.1 2-hydroxyglutaryl-CoA dehydratase [Caproicibacterium lactatifermentans]
MAELVYDNTGRLIFTKEMKKEYTILIPMMLPVHFKLFVGVLRNAGYKIELLENSGQAIVQEGLKYVHNDACYPAILVIGQFLDALHSGKYDLDHTALLLTQTGGGCRASNYIPLLRKALHKAGMDQIPIISLNLVGLEKNPGFSMTLPMISRMMAGVVYGDALMSLNNQIKPYEIEKGQSAALLDKWVEKLNEQFVHTRGISMGDQRKNLAGIMKDFSEIPVKKVSKIHVGIVGEIYVKYAPFANNHLEDFLAEQDCEVNVPGLMNFLLFMVSHGLDERRLYGGSFAKAAVVKLLFNYVTKMQHIITETFQPYPQFLAPTEFSHVRELVKGVIGYGAKMGEGWLLTGEMLELSECGFENIICAQPFGCLPNHVVGKGMIHKIKQIHPNANIVPIDYDPSATQVNQENRIKLMLAVARENLGKGKN